MHAYILRACVAAAAGVALSTVGVAGASASAAAHRAAHAGLAGAPSTTASSGTRLWVARYGGGRYSEGANAVAASPNGSEVFVTGTDTVAYNTATGARLWVARYGSGGRVATSVAVSPSGKQVFVTGELPGGYGTVAYNAATGARLWVTTGPGGPEAADAHSVAVSPDGSEVFVTGENDNAGSYSTVAYSAATGARLWVKNYHCDGLGDGYSVAVSPDGSKVFVTGQCATSTVSDYAYGTVAYSAATGTQLWAKRYGGADIAGAGSVAVSPDGSKVFVTGGSMVDGGSEHYATIAYNAATGTQLWAKAYGPSVAYSAVVSPDGSKVFVTGNNGFTSYTVAYSGATGTKLWTKAYRGTSPGGGGATSAGVSPDGKRVYITGFVGDIEKNGYGTVAYNTVTGTKLWAKTYLGPAGDSYAVALAVSPVTGTVFVTGRSESSTDHEGYATVAYSG